MTITKAIHEFILYKQSLGMTYKNRALKLTEPRPSGVHP